MTLFLVIAVVMVAAALAWILVPLLRPKSSTPFAREASNVAILRDQLAELDADLAVGTTSRVQYDEARRELEHRVLEESRALESPRGTHSPSAAWTAALIGSAIPLAALLLYATLGNIEALLPGAKRDVAGGGQSHEVTREQVEDMAARLAAKLEKDASNADGWVMLARTYYALQRNDDAVKAFDRAIALRPDDAGLLADYADALASTQGGIAGKPLALVERALKADPTHWKALALAGTAAFNRQDYKQAVAYWEKMKATVPPGSSIAASIDTSIAEARSLGGLGGATPPAVSAPQVVATRPTEPGAKATDTPAKSAGTATKPASGNATTIAGTVALAPALQGKVAPTDTVYIYARAAEGPRMPLAILRKQVRDLPISFKLDDTMAMAPNLALSNFADVVVGARVSKSGNATPQSGDLEGSSPAVKVGMSGISVVIDRALP
jgi:cytochrome c-type biogenesis protein CcmH